MTFAVRQLAPADVPQFQAMLAMFAAAFGEPGTYGGAPPSSAWLARLLARDHFIALAALPKAAHPTLGWVTCSIRSCPNGSSRFSNRSAAWRYARDTL